jgi:hypothetical protein
MGRRCASQNAGWRSWGLFFASFLWASKEMKKKASCFFTATISQVLVKQKKETSN